MTFDFHDLKPDCRQFRWDRPCVPHKLRGVECKTCDEYDPVRHSVLVVKLAAIGDVLRTTGFLPAIHAEFESARITWLTASGATALFPGNSLVDEVLDASDPATVARLRVERFDVVLCPDADPRAACLAASARAGERRGFTLDERGRVVPLGEGAEHWFRLGLSDPAKRQNRETYQDLVADVLALDRGKVAEPVLEPSTDDRDEAEAFRRALGFDGQLIGLNTGAGGRWEYKQWTLDHQQAFLQLATDAGYGVILLGGPEEVERHRQLLDAARGRAVYDGGTDNSFGGFAAKVELCRAIVTGDTLAVHVAAARKVPAIVLFGPTSAAEIELFGRGEKIVPELECVCCYLPRCDREPHCQALIAPAKVMAAVERVVSRKS